MTLTIDVFNSGYLPVNGGPGWDPGSNATWPASTATLIAGERDAILVDALMTIDEGHQLVSWIGEAGKNLTSIIITHGHGDHFFGLASLLERFPRAKAVAAPRLSRPCVSIYRPPGSRTSGFGFSPARFQTAF